MEVVMKNSVRKSVLSALCAASVLFGAGQAQGMWNWKTAGLVCFNAFMIYKNVRNITELLKDIKPTVKPGFKKAEPEFQKLADKFIEYPKPRTPWEKSHLERLKRFKFHEVYKDPETENLGYVPNFPKKGIYCNPEYGLNARTILHETRHLRNKDCTLRKNIIYGLLKSVKKSEQTPESKEKHRKRNCYFNDIKNYYTSTPPNQRNPRLQKNEECPSDFLNAKTMHESLQSLKQYSGEYLHDLAQSLEKRIEDNWEIQAERGTVLGLFHFKELNELITKLENRHHPESTNPYKIGTVQGFEELKKRNPTDPFVIAASKIEKYGERFHYIMGSCRELAEDYKQAHFSDTTLTTEDVLSILAIQQKNNTLSIPNYYNKKNIRLGLELWYTTIKDEKKEFYLKIPTTLNEDIREKFPVQPNLTGAEKIKENYKKIERQHKKSIQRHLSSLDASKKALYKELKSMTNQITPDNPKEYEEKDYKICEV